MRLPTGIAAVLAAIITAPIALAGAQPALAALPAVGTAAPDTTSAVEAKRVDSVPTPQLDWWSCYGVGDCATMQVPVDYDEPTGSTVDIAVLRIKAKNQKAKIGTLFLNPGGPGGSGVQIAAAAPYFLSDDVLKRFDIVGFDPRGVGFSQNIKCFASAKEQAKAYAGFNVAFPYTKAEERAFITSDKAIGTGCSASAPTVAGAMSTAEAARDMDVLRRAVGDSKLTYLGFSYGTALGQYYANMFPDRVRAIVVDGVVNPVGWVGDPAHADAILDDRLHSADGSYKALHELLVRCKKAGRKYCEFARGGDPLKKFDFIVAKLRKKPLVIKDVDGSTFVIKYSDVVSVLLSVLYSPDPGDFLASIAQFLYDQLTGKGDTSKAQQAAAAAMAKSLLQRRPAYDFPYDNSLEAFLGVTCTDGVHPKNAASWRSAAAAADKRAPYFGRLWGWNDSACASNTWTVRDEDAYTGPFNRRTGAPVLIVGDYFDPATNYDSAVASSKLLPNSRLLSSDSWGHTAYGTSACVTDAVDKYLLKGALPKVGTVCVGDMQPYTVPIDDGTKASLRGHVAGARVSRAPSSLTELAARGLSSGQKQLPPVVSPIPGLATD